MKDVAYIAEWSRVAASGVSRAQSVL